MNINEEFEEDGDIKDLDLTLKKNILEFEIKVYDEYTLNRISIVILTQVGVQPKQITALFKVSRVLVSKLVNYDRRKPKKRGDNKSSPKNKKNLFKKSEGKLTIINNKKFGIRFWKKI